MPNARFSGKQSKNAPLPVSCDPFFFVYCREAVAQHLKIPEPNRNCSKIYFLNLMNKGQRRYITPAGQVPKYPVLQGNISTTRDSHDKDAGGGDCCFAARPIDSMKRSALCKLFFLSWAVLV